MLEIILNIIFIVILFLTIIFCIRLERRINNLRDKNSEMILALNNLDKTLLNAQESIKVLKNLKEYINIELENQNNRSKEIICDLEFANSIGNGSINKMEELISNSKKILNDINDKNTFYENFNKSLEEKEKFINNKIVETENKIIEINKIFDNFRRDIIRYDIFHNNIRKNDNLDNLKKNDGVKNHNLKNDCVKNHNLKNDGLNIMKKKKKNFR